MKPYRGITADEALENREWVGRLARALSASDDDAEDLAQEAWLVAATSHGAARGALGGWLTGVLRKLAAMRSRSSARRLRREASDLLREGPPTADALMEVLETQQLLARLVGELPEKERVVVLLRYFEGLSSSEIASQLGEPPGTIRWRLKQAVEQLRQRLDEATGGSRERWLGLLLPLADRGGNSTSFATEMLLMKAKKMLAGLVAAVLACMGLLWWIESNGRPAVAATAVQEPSARDRTEPTGLNEVPADQPLVLPAWMAQSAVSSRRLSGRVLLDGRPISGAVVRLEPEWLAQGQSAEFRRTDAAGSFDFGLKPPMPYSVGASKEGRSGSVASVDLRDPLLPADSVELHLGPCEALLWGRVTDAASGPVVGASVRPAGGAGALSDDHGKYELCVLAGENSLHVEASGYGAVALEAVAFGRTERNIVLVPEATVVGRVIRPGSAGPVVGALVAAEPAHFSGKESVRGRVTLTGPDGRFQLQLAPGEYSLAARHGNASSGAPVMVTMLVDRRGPEVTLSLREGSALRGIVRSSGKPVSGANVSVFSLSGGARAVSGFSQADGTFVIQGAPRGAVMFTAAPWAVLTPKRYEVKRADEIVELEVAPQAALRGVVTLRGQPVPAAIVKATSGYNEASTRTDAVGRYELKALRSGRYHVSADSEAAGGYVERPNVELAAPDARELNLELESAGTIAGRVVDEGGGPVPGAMVVFTHTSTGYWGRGVADADGKYRCGQLAGHGTYRAAVFPSAVAQVPFKLLAAMKPVFLADGESHVEDVELRIKLERKSLRGRVVDSDGQPVADVLLRLEEAAPGTMPSFSPWAALPRTVSDLNGRFAFEGLPVGTWAVQARAPDGSEATEPAIDPGATEVTLTVQPSAGVDGTLVGYGSPPAAIYARPYPGVGRLIRGEQDGERFRIALPPGSWIVSAINANEGDVQRVEVHAGERVQLTMKSRGRGRIRGTVVDYLTGAPIEGLVCHFLSTTDGTAGITRWDVETAPRTDQQGVFDVDPVPAGDGYVECVGDWNQLSTASALYRLEPGQESHLALAVVRRQRPPPDGDIGLQFDDNLVTGATAAIPVVRGVRTGSVAHKAGVLVGDVVVAIDGRPVAPLDASGVEMLIINHAPGSALSLSVTRAGVQREFAVTTELAER